jgi:alpha-N-arabinofuranosidase
MTRITVDADGGHTTISRHIYGHFAEHLGRCIYDGFWVGEDSPIPNTRGIRNDLVDALRRIGIPNLRWPGGCFADEYHWMDGIGPREQRPMGINSHWGGVTESNHFGTHEFMDLCEQLGCEPYICGNVGSGSVREMQQWVEYLTSDGDDAMAQLRRANGREEPWKIKFWGVGNENWGCGGHMRPAYYADQYRQYVTYLRNIGGNTLYPIACGADAGAAGGDYAWTEVLMQRVAQKETKHVRIDGLSLHYYTRPAGGLTRTTATEFGEQDWFQLLKSAWLTEELVRRHATIMDRYDPAKRVAMIVDEWGTWHDVEPGTNPRFLYQQNTLRDALVAAVSLDIFNRHAERVRGAQIAQTINVLQAVALTQGEAMLLTPTYHVFDLYQGHQDATLVPLEMQSARYSLGDESMPAVSASASRNKAGGLLLTMSNLDPTTKQAVTCELRGAAFKTVTGRALSAQSMQAHNTFAAPNELRPEPFELARIEGATLTVSLPAKSIVALEIT